MKSWHKLSFHIHVCTVVMFPHQCSPLGDGHEAKTWTRLRRTFRFALCPENMPGNLTMLNMASKVSLDLFPEINVHGGFHALLGMIDPWLFTTKSMQRLHQQCPRFTEPPIGSATILVSVTEQTHGAHPSHFTYIVLNLTTILSKW